MLPLYALQLDEVLPILEEELKTRSLTSKFEGKSRAPADEAAENGGDA
jgi:hypothetical protein